MHVFVYESQQLCVYKTCVIPQVVQEDRTPAEFRKRYGATEEAAQCDSGQSFTADTEPRNCTEEREASHSGGEVGLAGWRTQLTNAASFFIVMVVRVTHNSCCSSSSRRKLAQLQHAYTCLFQDYDKKLKSEKQANHRVGSSCL